MKIVLTALVIVMVSSAPAGAEETVSSPKNATEADLRQPAPASGRDEGKSPPGKADKAKQAAGKPARPQTGSTPGNQKASGSGKDGKQSRNQNQGEFVDRDGDGIRDGQEHRFRGTHRRRHRLRWLFQQPHRGQERHRGQNRGRH